MNQASSARTAAQRDPRESTLESYARAFPDVDIDTLETHLSLAVASGAIDRGIEARIRTLGFELTRPRYTIVRMLYLSPEQALPQSEIAQSMNVSGANVTQLIDALVADGWVERIVNPADRRVTHAQLTSSGKERCAVLVPAIVDFMLDSCNVLTTEEQTQLRHLVNRVRDRIEDLNS
jgi:MarR family transcriptional regulator, transcriptional regulator for hemolysin